MQACRSVGYNKEYIRTSPWRATKHLKMARFFKCTDDPLKSNCTAEKLYIRPWKSEQPSWAKDEWAVWYWLKKKLTLQIRTAWTKPQTTLLTNIGAAKLVWIITAVSVETFPCWYDKFNISAGKRCSFCHLFLIADQEIRLDLVSADRVV